MKTNALAAACCLGCLVSGAAYAVDYRIDTTEGRDVRQGQLSRINRAYSNFRAGDQVNVFVTISNFTEADAPKMLQANWYHCGELVHQQSKLLSNIETHYRRGLHHVWFWIDSTPHLTGSGKVDVFADNQRVGSANFQINNRDGSAAACFRTASAPASAPAPVAAPIPVAAPAPILISASTSAPVVTPVAAPAPVVVPTPAPVTAPTPVAAPAPILISASDPAPVVTPDPVAAPAPIAVPAPVAAPAVLSTQALITALTARSAPASRSAPTPVAASASAQAPAVVSAPVTTPTPVAAPASASTQALVAALAARSAPASVPAPAPAPVSVPASASAPATTMAWPTFYTLPSDTLFHSDGRGRHQMYDGTHNSGVSQVQTITRQIRSRYQDNHIRRITVIGYTDYLGDDSHNLSLSRHRAETVKQIMVEGGIPAGLIQAVGGGKAKPVKQCSPVLSPSRLKECLAPNRRVEISIETR